MNQADYMWLVELVERVVKCTASAFDCEPLPKSAKSQPISSKGQPTGSKSQSTHKRPVAFFDR
jgi:hypothetical protein